LSLSAILFLCTLVIENTKSEEEKNQNKIIIKKTKNTTKQNPNCTRRIFISSVGVVKILLLGYISQDWSLQLSTI
jgi:hypothetical protein